MADIWKKVRGIVILVVIFIVVPFSALALFWQDRCDQSVVQSIVSPDGRAVAEQVITSCGRSLKTASEVHLTKIDQGQRVGKEAAVLIIPSKTKMKISWDHGLGTPGQILSIELPDGQSEVVRYKDTWGDVRIALIGDIVSSVPERLRG